MSLTTNLLAYWKLDESSGNAADSSGNSYTLTNNNSTPYGTGKINNGIDFGSTEGNSYSLSNTTTPNLRSAFTVNFWIKVNTAPTTDDYIFGMWNSSAARYLTLSYSYNGGTYSLYLNASNQLTYITQTLTVGTWYMITVEGAMNSYGNTQTIYVNGNSIGTAICNNYSTSSNILSIGSIAAVVDEFGIWTRWLSGAELTTLYNAGAGLQYPFNTVYTFACLPASFSYTPQSTGNKRIKNFAMLPASYVYTGMAMTFSLAKIFLFNLLPATYTYTTQSINFKKMWQFVCLPTSYVLTGMAITWKSIKSYVFNCLPAQYVYTGMKMFFTAPLHTTWNVVVKSVTSWTKKTDPTSTNWNKKTTSQ